MLQTQASSYFKKPMGIFKMLFFKTLKCSQEIFFVLKYSITFLRKELGVANITKVLKFFWLILSKKFRCFFFFLN